MQQRREAPGQNSAATNGGKWQAMTGNEISEKSLRSLFAYLYKVPYIYASAVLAMGPRFRFAGGRMRAKTMKVERHSAIRELVTSSLIQNQDELRRKLRRRGFAVTQATLSRDLHELHLFKSPSGYSLSNGNGNSSPAAADDDDRPPSVAEVLDTFGLRSRQAMNQIVIATVMGGAQPVAAALDYEEWPEVLGTIAGDDTVLLICPDIRRAGEAQIKLQKILEG
jgi:transcriptional regulator of arginine metabolism